MSDGEPEESAGSDPNDGEQPDADGFVWQSGDSEEGTSGDDGGPVDSRAHVTEEEPGTRIWHRITGDTDDTADSETPADDQPDPATGQSDAPEAPDGDDPGGEVPKDYFPEATPPPEVDQPSGGGRNDRGSDQSPESPDVEPRDSDRIWRSAPDVDQPTSGVPEPTERYRWMNGPRRSRSRENSGAQAPGEPFSDEPTVDTPPERDVTPSESGPVEQLDADALGSQVLLLGPPDHATTEEACARLFQSGTAAEFDVVFVTFEQTAAERTAVFKHLPGDHRGSVGVVEVGVYGKAASPVVDPGTTGTVDDVTIKRLSDPTNVSKLGIMISQLVSKMESADRPVVVCFHSVTALGSYVDTEQLFRFLHILTGLLSSENARGHFHVDPAENSHMTVRTIAPLFDSVVRVSPEGQVEVE